MSAVCGPLTLTLSPGGEGMATCVWAVQSLFTPSPLRVEGWGEGATTPIAQHSHTERTA